MKNDTQPLIKNERAIWATVGFHNGKLKKERRILDFISSGWTMNMYCAIDFTESNKIFTDPSSLHYLSDEPNDYEQALLSVGRILENFSKTYKCVGFGA